MLYYQSSTSLSLTSSDSASAVYGETLTFTAKVTPSAATGTVTFTDTTTGNVLASNVAVSGGVATMTTSSLAVGSHNISAVYTPVSDSYIGSNASLTQAIAMSGTSTLLKSSLNPSSFGSTVTFTATVSPSGLGSGAPTGTVSFYDGGSFLITEPMTAGVATYSTSTLSAATHNITAVYSDDSNFKASTSNTVAQVVNSTTAPSVSSVAINPNQNNLGNSRVLSIQVNFNEPVDISSLADAFTLTNVGTPNGGRLQRLRHSIHPDHEYRHRHHHCDAVGK